MSPTARYSRRLWMFGPLPLLSAAIALGCGSASPGEAVGQDSLAGTAFPNDLAAFQFFVGQGLTQAQAAGIVGNLDQESGDSPTAMQQGGPGMGLAQWSIGGRWDTDSGDNCVAFAAGAGESVDSLTLQLQFIWFELQKFPEYGLGSLRASTNVTDATVAFMTDFEACGECDQSNRMMYAEAVLAAYGSGTGSGGTGECYSHTLGKYVGPGTCVDSSTNGEIYECVAGDWILAVDIPTQTCTGGVQHAGGSGSAGCYSETLHREVPDNACVQSGPGALWYQCDNGQWVDRWTDPTACDGLYVLESQGDNQPISLRQ